MPEERHLEQLCGTQFPHDAIDKVTVMWFDGHGNRIWREARALLDHEYARYPDCPLRFRCDHVRTDVAVTVVRGHRSTSLGLPRPRQAAR